MKIKRSGIFIFLVILTNSVAIAQDNYWKKSISKSVVNLTAFEQGNLKDIQFYQLDIEMFKNHLLSAVKRATDKSSFTEISFPNSEGKLERFSVYETQILSPEIATKYPQIKTYIGFGIDSKGARVRFSVSPTGLNTMFSYPDKLNYFIAPTKIKDQYILYSRSKERKEVAFMCKALDKQIKTPLAERIRKKANDQTLRTFRIAISTTGEYTQFWDDGNDGNGNAKQDAFAQVVSTINRVNEVFEVDLAINFQIISDTKIIYDDPNTDPYSTSFSIQIQNTLTSEIGEANYDIGHLFHYSTTINTGNGGCIGCVCVDGRKGSGFSQHTFLDNDGGAYMTDFFDIDYVSHEIGHQMGGRHTWSFNSQFFNTGSVEPGSGSTIMGYAGVPSTGSSSIQDHTDAYFHYYSINEILNNIATKNCFTTTNITNNPPVADAGNDFTIPKGTAFILKGAATDSDKSDVLTYTWEQIDPGFVNFRNFGSTSSTGAMFRSRPPNTSPNRYMPNMNRILLGKLTEERPLTNDPNGWETVSEVSRDLNFALTVRDQSESNGSGKFPQNDSDVMKITVDEDSGPFLITSQTNGKEWERGSMQTVTWDVAGTDSGNINAVNVRIILSTDGGLIFDIVLAENVPNNGSVIFTVPNDVPLTPKARVMVEAVGNIFLAVNSTDFPIIERTTSTDQFGLEGVQLYPNPSYGKMTISFDLNTFSDVILNLFDISGRKIFEKKYVNQSGRFSQEVDFSGVSTGIYLLKILNGKKVTAQKLIIK